MDPLTSFNKFTLQPTATPFQNIGLAFSGGGFRASSFCLGTLSYFNELQWEDGRSLLQNVSYISSASGGTITNATYALSVARKKDFHTFYGHLFGQLEGLKLLTNVFEILNDDKCWKEAAYKEKRRNLINAFAIAYDRTLFSWPGEDEGATLQALMDGNPKGHLDEVCFNTTEFYRGVLFRQAVKLKPDKEDDKEFLYGNYILNLINNVQRDIRLADTLAASSCFPAGFEPIVFPSDFITAKLSRDELLRNTRVEPQELKWAELLDLFGKKDIDEMLGGLPQPIQVPVLSKAVVGMEEADKFKRAFETGFMDGGIDDNQGIDSLMRANYRREQKCTSFRPFDLMMTNDVGSHYMDPYTPMKRKVHRGLMAFSLRTLLWTSVVLACTGLALIAAALLPAKLGYETAMAMAGTAMTLLFGGLAAGLMYLRTFIRGKTGDSGLNLQQVFSPQITERFFRFFGGTPIGVLIDMLKERFNSVLTLNNDVFLKRIRQLLYERILDEGKGCFRMKTNHVYDLAYSNDANRLSKDGEGGDLQELPQDLQIVAQCAFEMGTTLWFGKPTGETREYNQAALIATGQFTTCYNLLVYIVRMKALPKTGKSHYEQLEPQWQQKVDLVQGQVDAHFKRFCENPFWLYNELGRHCGAGFREATMEDYPFPKELFERLRTEDLKNTT